MNTESAGYEYIERFTRSNCGVTVVYEVHVHVLRRHAQSTDDFLSLKEGRKVPRKGYIAKREVLPDPIYHDQVVTKLINNIMLDGKKGVAQKICYDAFELVREKTGKEPLEAFKEALNNVMPQLEVKARRVGGSTYQVPMEVRPERRQALGLRWIVLFARKRNEKTMSERLANEILDAINSVGGAFKRKEEMHRMAEANRAFAHYRW
jgi:small subunit ribosomal protein S7